MYDSSGQNTSVAARRVKTCIDPTQICFAAKLGEIAYHLIPFAIGCFLECVTVPISYWDLQMNVNKQSQRTAAVLRGYGKKHLFMAQGANPFASSGYFITFYFFSLPVILSPLPFSGGFFCFPFLFSSFLGSVGRNGRRHIEEEGRYLLIPSLNTPSVYGRALKANPP